jgi:hypothetical protein
MAARVITSCLATAGAFYVDAMPALIDAFEVANGATHRAAGIVGAANMYGGACGSMILALWVRRARWYELSSRTRPWTRPAAGQCGLASCRRSVLRPDRSSALLSWAPIDSVC